MTDVPSPAWVKPEALPRVPYQFPQAPLPPSAPRLAIVGEAPGADEVRLGLPFVGRSGRLLDENLKAAGINRQECLVANVFCHQPPGNRVGCFFASSRRAAATGEAIAGDWGRFGAAGYCRTAFLADLLHLRQSLQIWQPTALLLLGGVPLWAFSGRSGILAARGPLAVAENRLLPGVPAVATYHPSYLLRGQWALRPQWQADMRTAWELAGR